MEYGRLISPQDKDILKELKRYWRNSVKIDFDITHEPCIFFEYCGAWNLVYKLSKDGSYQRNRWSYVSDIHDAIRSFIVFQKQIRYEEEKKYQENFERKRSEFTGKIKEDDGLI